MKRAARVIALISVWGTATAVTSWTLPTRQTEDTPKALEVLTVAPAHARPPGAMPASAFDAADYQQRRQNEATVQQAAVLLEEQRKAEVERQRQQEEARRRAAARVVVTTRPTPRPVSGDGCGGWRDLVDNYAWDVDKACRILLCESGGDPNAVGPRTRYGTAQGLMQILPGGSFDPATNMAQAWAKYQARGWQPWVCQ